MKKKSFTLMELLTVLAIISILAALTMGGVQAVRRRATKAKAEAAIAALEVALGMYYNDLGEYPGTVGSAVDCEVLVRALVCKDSREDWDGPYIRFKEKELSCRLPSGEECNICEENCRCNYLDPWGNFYIYEKTDDFYLISSKGPDGIKGNKDDISSK